MKAVVQRVKACSVSIDGKSVASTGPGLLVLLGVAAGDRESDADFLAEKVIHLRIFEDDQGKMNLSLLQTGGELMVVSQFTLLADCRKGRRPSFVNAAPHEQADALYERFVAALRRQGVAVQTGRFAAIMDVSLINSGPVTILLESPAP